MTFRFRIFLSAMAIMGAMALSSCNNASANQAKSDISVWFQKLLTPGESTLEKVNSGYSVKGNIKNKPNNLVMLFEVSPAGLQILDSTRTDSKGDFTLSGNVKESLICQLQWGESSLVYMIIDNKTQAKIELSGAGLDVTYALSGKGIEASSEMKQLIDLNVKYLLELQSIQDRANNLPPTEEGYLQGQALQGRYYALLGERNAAIRSMTLTFKQSLVPYFVIISGMLEDVDLPLLEHAKQSAVAFSESGKYAKDMVARYEQEKLLAVGSIAPEITQKQPDGTDLSLSKLRGKLVLIDFWASWCGPCRAENPMNRKLYEKYKSRGFEIFGVSLDSDAGRWKGAIARDSLTWYHVSDLGGWGSQPAKLYKVSSIPATYLIDKEGRIIAKGLRGEQLKAKLEELLGE